MKGSNSKIPIISYYNYAIANINCVHTCRPNLLDYYSCDFSEPLHCLERAFSIAEDELNITQLVEPKCAYI